MTTAMRPFTRPSATASMSAWRLLPRPETSTPSRALSPGSTVFIDGAALPDVRQRGAPSLVVMDGGFVAGDHFPDQACSTFAPGRQFVEDLRGGVGSRDDDHPDSHVEGAQRVVLRYTSGLLQEPEQRGYLPRAQ